MDALQNTTATGEPATEMNFEEGFNVTSSVIQHSVFVNMFITSFFLTWGPGIISNTLAMFFLVLDIKQISMPLLVLLLTLIFSNLLAVIFSLIRHLLGVYVVPTFSLCASITFLHSFFKLTAGSVNTMMAADRVLAIYAPFFYDRRITVNTWKAGCVIAVTVTSFCSALPWLGLGNVISVGQDGSLVCTGFYGEVPRHKVFPFTFSLFGATFILVIVCCNAALIRGLLKLNRSVVVLTDRGPSSATPIDVTESSGNSATSRIDTKMAFEVAFAKLMFCMASAYLICGAPNYVSSSSYYLQHKINLYCIENPTLIYFIFGQIFDKIFNQVTILTKEFLHKSLYNI